METRLAGPGGAYTVRLLVQAAVEDKHREVAVDSGFPAAGRGEWPEYHVLAGNLVSFHLEAQAEGLRVHRLRPLAADRLTVVAEVRAGPGAPEWLPRRSRYLLFDGDRQQASRQAEAYQRFGQREGWTEECVAVDRLITAIGQAVARSNHRLARQPGKGGVALVSSMRLRIAVSRVDVNDEQRVLVTLARPGEANSQQIELVFTTVPSDPEDEARPPAGG